MTTATHTNKYIIFNIFCLYENPTGIKHTHCDRTSSARARDRETARSQWQRLKRNEFFFCSSFSCQCIRLISYLLVFALVEFIFFFFSRHSLESESIYAKRANERRAAEFTKHHFYNRF